MRRTHVIAGVGIVIVLGCSGLLLTGVQRVREAAVRAKCHCHLKCLALAVHGYADWNRTISATVSLPAVPPDRRLSWLVPVLPYMEQGRVFEQFDLSVPADDGRNRAAAEARLFAFVCPVSGPSEWNKRLTYYESVSAITHYVGVAGVGADAAELPAGHPMAGAFGYDRRTTVFKEGFPDGMASTFLIVETAHDPGHWAVGGAATVRPFISETAPYIGAGRPFGGWHTEGFWRNHGLMNVAMADGSIRTIRSDIDSGVLEALATANGREAVPADW